MQILNTSGTYTLRVIPRKFDTTGGKIKLNNDRNADSYSTTTPTSISIDGNYLKLDFSLSPTNQLIEGEFYKLEVWDSQNKVNYMDTIFCTDQDINQSDNEYYNINENQYIPNNQNDNDYIII